MEKESILLGKKVDSLNRNAVARDQWKIEQKYQQAYENDANQIARLALQSTQRELLSYKIFPEPKDRIFRIRSYGNSWLIMINLDPLCNRWRLIAYNNALPRMVIHQNRTVFDTAGKRNPVRHLTIMRVTLKPSYRA